MLTTAVNVESVKQRSNQWLSLSRLLLWDPESLDDESMDNQPVMGTVHSSVWILDTLGRARLK